MSTHKSIVVIMIKNAVEVYLLLLRHRSDLLKQAFFHLQRREHWRHRYRWRVQTLEQDCSFQCFESYKGCWFV